MNTAVTLAECFAAASVANRVPTWAEYKNGSPAEQRAIENRWREIRSDLKYPTQEAWKAETFLRWVATSKMTDEQLVDFIDRPRDNPNYDAQVQTGSVDPNTGRPETMSCGDMYGE